MKRHIAVILAGLLVAASLLSACASSSASTSASASASAATPSATVSASASASSKPAASASAKPAASAPASAKPAASPKASAEGGDTPQTNDLAALLLGTWSTSDNTMTMTFTKDGVYTGVDNGVTYGPMGYTTKQQDNASIVVKTSTDSVVMTFTDRDHLTSNDISFVRVFENEQVNTEASLIKLLLGSWLTTEGGSLTFTADGNMIVKQAGKPDSSSPYTIEGIDETSMKITITDDDGQKLSENASFTDNNTLVLGEAVLTRAG